jgi:hypothetical protein
MLKLVTQRAGGTHPGRVVVRPPRIRAHSLHASDLSWWLIRPSRGRWMLDEAGLDALDLSPDVMDLSQSRRARSVCGLDGAVVAAGVADAVGHGLVEPADGERRVRARPVFGRRCWVALTKRPGGRSTNAPPKGGNGAMADVPRHVYARRAPLPARRTRPCA